MDLQFSREDKVFREEARDWLNSNCPCERRPHAGEAMREFDLAWQKRQYEGGWAGVSWPPQYGGLGLSLTRQLIWHEEYARADAPDNHLCFVALNHAGPTIIARGSEAQKQEHLPKILSGRTIWCQGFSEPNAGSDLGSLKTRAHIDGEYLVVNGSKIWTSHGHLSDWQELLVRTDPEAPKHKGISWVICDMRSAGITLRPIEIMTSPNQVHFVQCFYDDVRIPLANVVGAVNDGWNVAMSTLGFERGTAQIRDMIRYAFLLERMIERAQQRLGADCPLSKDEIGTRLAQLRADMAAARAMTYMVVSRAQAGISGSESSLMRAMVGETQQRARRLALDILGPYALENPEDDDWVYYYLRSFAITIAAGTAQIQRNIIGERVLGLPR
ncbi:acyl-CoA dehydrogenase family protein [Paraburkholderia sp. GAS32]|jgi:alkylation response protein AidB-like acyl-CoA dehydrogenase|uniref:acyl-CoA dehydrogenase family protein n=1 Tax=Paraburkholderia sp. GAS32 TaxID=3035129 RepID=UPI003D1B8679